MYAEIFSRLSPTINDVIVVAMLLPSIIPMLLLNVRILAFISPIVSIITAELDCIKAVEIKPTNRLFEVEEVNFKSFCLTLFNDKEIRLLLNMSIEYIKRIIPPSNKVIVIISPLKYIKKTDKI